MNAPPLTLDSLTLRDFRNLVRADLSFPPPGVVIVGENGQGKTNLLEAVHYLHLLRSARGTRDADVVRFGAPGFHLRAGATGGAHHEIGVGFLRQGRHKRVRLDGIECPRLSDALGALPSVLVSPADVELVAGAPRTRRRFLDILLALTSRRYLVALQRYRTALLQRNAALRTPGARHDAEERAAVWEAPLAEHGALLWCERVAWTEAAAPRFAALCADIGESAPVTLRYETTLVPEERTLDSVRRTLLDGHARRRALDLRRGLTHTGPHRDDLAFVLGAHALRPFGSAGQQRTAAIALRLLERETLRARLHLSPLLLLDDPFAELDARRSARILELLGGEGAGQTILTVPRESDIPPALTPLARWTLSGGAVSARDGAGAVSPPRAPEGVA